MNGLVAVDHSGNAIGDALIHADIRGAAHARRLETDYGIDAIYARTLNRPDSHLTLPKAMWAAEQRPDLLNSAACIVQANDYLASRLTGVTGRHRSIECFAHRWFRSGCIANGLSDLWSASGVETRLLPASRSIHCGHWCSHRLEAARR